MDVDAWRERQINKRTQRYIEERDRAFQMAHATDTDAELREHVRKKARELHRMPHPLELQGGLFLRKRLGDWDALARSFGLEPVGKNQGRNAYLSLRKTGEALFTAERRALKTAKNQNRSVEELLPQPAALDEG